MALYARSPDVLPPDSSTNPLTVRVVDQTSCMRTIVVNDTSTLPREVKDSPSLVAYSQDLSSAQLRNCTQV